MMKYITQQQQQPQQQQKSLDNLNLNTAMNQIDFENIPGES